MVLKVNLETENQDFATYGKLHVRKKRKQVLDVLKSLDEPEIVCMHNGAKITAKISVLQFWEKLKLSPLSGQKNVKWVAIFPNDKRGLEADIPMYMDSMRAMWDLLLFGDWQPVFSSGKQPGAFPVLVGDSPTVSNVLRLYSTLFSSIAKCISKTMSVCKDAYVVVHIWSPLPISNGHVLDFSCLFAKLLANISATASLPLSYVQHFVAMELVPETRIQLLTSQLDSDISLSYKTLCFKAYDRMKARISTKDDTDAVLWFASPAYTLDSINLSKPYLQAELSKNRNALLILEPDRIWYVMFGRRETGVFAVWSDATQEFVFSEWKTVTNVAVYIWERTLELMGTRGFAIRLVVINVDGWVPGDASGKYQSEIVWKEIHSKCDKVKETPAVVRLHLPTPEAVDRVSSLSLVHLNYESNLDIFHDTDHVKPDLHPEVWSTAKHRTLLFSLQNSKDDWFPGETSLASAWLLYPQLQSGSSYSVGISLIHHHSETNSPTCFSAWEDNSLGSRYTPNPNHVSVVRDISQHLYSFSTHTNLPWQFDLCLAKLSCYSKLLPLF